MKLNSRASSGVTLIETILVITLLAAASATGLILFDGSWTARRTVRTATEDVSQTLVTARNSAINSQAIVLIRRDNSGGSAKLLVDEQPGPFRNGRSWTFEMGPEVRLSGNPAEFQFRPDGTADRNVRWQATSSGISGSIDVAPVTGVVTRTKP